MSKQIFSCYHTKGFLWFRVFGYGLKIKDTKHHDLLFSERVLGKGLRVGRFQLGALGK